MQICHFRLRISFQFHTPYYVRICVTYQVKLGLYICYSFFWYTFVKGKRSKLESMPGPMSWNMSLKWPIFSETGKIGTGKNPKSGICRRKSQSSKQTCAWFLTSLVWKIVLGKLDFLSFKRQHIHLSQHCDSCRKVLSLHLSIVRLIISF